MLYNVIISILVLYGGYSAIEGGYQAFYEPFAHYIADHASMLFIYGAGSAITLIVLSFIFAGLGWYAIMFILSKCFFWLSQFLISLISVAAVVFWFDLQQNLWWDLGFLVGAIPFIALIASGYSLKQFDFNYPVTRAFEASMALPVLSGLIIFISAYLSG